MESGEANPTVQPLVAHRIRSFVGDEKAKVPTWRSILFGNIDGAYFYRPLNLYAADPAGRQHMRFRRCTDFTPILMLILLGFQHACAALSTVISPTLILKAFSSTVFDDIMQASVIIAGIFTIINSLEIKIPLVPYQLGTGLLSVLTNSRAFLMTFILCMVRMVQEDGESMHDAYGKMLGTTAVVSLAYIALTFVPWKYAKLVFTPFVSGIIITFIGIERLILAIQLWGGGVACSNREIRGIPICTDTGDVKEPYGSPEYLGIGLLVLVVYGIIELFGSPFARHNSVTISAMSVFVFSAIVRKDGHHYVTGNTYDDIPEFAFLWTTTYKLGFYKEAIIPLIGAFLVLYLESTAIYTSTIEESKIGINTEEASNKIQAGLIMSGIGTFISTLATGLPLVPCPQNNILITVTGQASNMIGVATGVWLFIFGIFGHLLATYLEVPVPISGALGAFLLSGVIWSGLKILSREAWNRRRIVILVYSLTFGLARVLVPNFINDNLYRADDDMKGFEISFRYAVITLLRVNYFLGGFVACILNVILPTNMTVDAEQTYEEEAGEAYLEA